MKILEYHSPITPFTVYIVGDWFSLTFKYAYKIPEYIVCNLRAIHIEKFCEEVEFLSALCRKTPSFRVEI